MLAEMNAEKLLIAASLNKSSSIVLGPLKGETKAQRENRQREYLEDLVDSKHEEMKRKLLDLVDNIHKDEMDELETDLKKVSTDMREWQKKCEEPVNFEVFVVSKLQQIEKKREKNEQFKQQMAQCDTVSMNKEKLAELTDLCKHYGMRDFVKDKIKLNDRQMFD